MSWLRRRNDQEDVRLARISEADRKARELLLRSERVASALEARQRRNHWGETVAGIVAASQQQHPRG
jgi:hypothetical protein